MMSRLWLAAVLGILLGLGIAFVPTNPVGSLDKAYLPINTLAQQRNLESAASRGPPDFQFAILALLVGLVGAAPFFLVARRRSR